MAQDHDYTKPVALTEVAAGEVRNNVNATRSAHSGATAPSDPVDGMLWEDTSVTPHVFKKYEGASWIVINRSYVHTQATPSTTWVVVHGLGRYPCVTLTTGTDILLPQGIVYDSLNQLTVSYTAAVSGVAYCS